MNCKIKTIHYFATLSMFSLSYHVTVDVLGHTIFWPETSYDESIIDWLGHFAAVVVVVVVDVTALVWG